MRQLSPEQIEGPHQSEIWRPPNISAEITGIVYWAAARALSYGHAKLVWISSYAYHVACKWTTFSSRERIWIGSQRLLGKSMQMCTETLFARGRKSLSCDRLQSFHVSSRISYLPQEYHMLREQFCEPQAKSKLMSWYACFIFVRFLSRIERFCLMVRYFKSFALG